MSSLIAGGAITPGWVERLGESLGAACAACHQRKAPAGRRGKHSLPPTHGLRTKKIVDQEFGWRVKSKAQSRKSLQKGLSGWKSKQSWSGQLNQVRSRSKDPGSGQGLKRRILVEDQEKSKAFVTQSQWLVNRLLQMRDIETKKRSASILLSTRARAVKTEWEALSRRLRAQISSLHLICGLGFRSIAKKVRLVVGAGWAAEFFRSVLHN